MCVVKGDRERKTEPVQSRQTYSRRMQATSLQQKKWHMSHSDLPSTFDVYYSPYCERD